MGQTVAEFNKQKFAIKFMATSVSGSAVYYCGIDCCMPISALNFPISASNYMLRIARKLPSAEFVRYHVIETAYFFIADISLYVVMQNPRKK